MMMYSSIFLSILMCGQTMSFTIYKLNSLQCTSSSSKLILKSSFDSDEEDMQFMQDLQQAKQKLGASIEITEEEETARNSAENDFLAAMKQVSKNFKESKEEVGADRAIDLLKSQWDQEEKLMELDDDDIDGEFQ